MKLESDKVEKFMYAGKAFITIKNNSNDNRFTYKIQKNKDYDMFFVSVLQGENKEYWRSYTYIGIIKNKHFSTTPKSKLSYNDMEVRAFCWFIQNMGNWPVSFEVYHEGRCGKCGRKLTVPESIKSGFGSKCYKIMENKRG